jgi:hypothetical protein
MPLSFLPDQSVRKQFLLSVLWQRAILCSGSTFSHPSALSFLAGQWCWLPVFKVLLLEIDSRGVHNVVRLDWPGNVR